MRSRIDCQCINKNGSIGARDDRMEVDEHRVRVIHMMMQLMVVCVGEY